MKSIKINELEELIGIYQRPDHEAKLGEATPALYYGTYFNIKVRIKDKSAYASRPHAGTNSIDAASLAISEVRVGSDIPHSANAKDEQYQLRYRKHLI